MTMLELLNLIYQAGVQNHEGCLLHATLNYETGVATFTNSIGPFEPRTRTVTITPDNLLTATQAKVEYNEIKHGTFQAATSAESDLTDAAEVSRLIDRIWTHLKG